jgi:CheY-like chemotaxis protein
MTAPAPKEVLVVEDQPIIRMMAADALTDRGMIAWEAGDASEALKLLDEHQTIGVVFTDVNIPGEMSGIDLARQVQKSRPDVGLIITSGAMRVSDGDLPDHGTFLAKPYVTQQLVDLVHQKFDDATSSPT